MKVEYTKDYFIRRIKNLDVRAKTLTDEQIDDIINDGFAEVCTVGMYYSDEEVVDMKEYYSSGELRVTLDIEEDVTSIYDYYLTQENQATDIFPHGIRKLQNTKFREVNLADINSMWLDNRYSGRVHIDLSEIKSDIIADNAVIKYFYIPSSKSSSYFMDAQTRLATESGMASALYEYLHDIEKAGQKRAAMKRQALSIVIHQEPEDLTTNYRAVFVGGGI